MKPFDLDIAIEKWVRQLRKKTGFEDADVLEMTQHIQDRVQHLLIEGSTEKEAFAKAVKEFGSIEEVDQALQQTRQPSHLLAWFFSIFPLWLRVFYRKTVHHKFYHIISLGSLAASIATALIIYKLVSFELSYDKHFSRHKQIHRLEASFLQGGQWIPSANNSWFAGEMVQEHLSGIEAVTRITPGRATFLRKDEEIFEKSLLVTSGNFFTVFDLPFVEGDPQTAFLEKAAIVLSETMAKRHFAEKPALGKTLQLKGSNRILKVTGVMRDIPPNTHFQADGIVNIEGLRDLYQEAFFKNPGWTSCFTYLTLDAKTNPAQLTDQFPRIISDYLGSTFDPADTKFLLRPLASIHLHSHSGEELSANGNLMQLRFLGTMASLILILALLNYLNLSTAGFATRFRETAIRRTVGASPIQILLRFLSETVLHFLLALMLGIGLIALASPILDTLISWPIISAFSFWEVMLLIAITILLGIACGLLPASYLSSLSPNKVLGSRSVQIKTRPMLRRALVTFQFMITAGMFLATAVIYYQYQFVKHYDRGFLAESVLAVPKYNMDVENYLALKDALLDHSNITAVGASSLVFPGALQSSISYRAPGDNGQKRSMKAVRTDHDFFSVFQMEIKEGVPFSANYHEERPQVILNEKAAQLLSWQDVENKWLEPLHLEHRAEVVGFAKDINFESLHNEVIPVAFLHDPANAHIMYLRLGTGPIAPTLSFIQENFHKFSQNRFEHWFVETTLSQQYAQEQTFTKVFSLFTLIAILIAFAGLYGLSKFMCERKTKEIGIRKILGASPLQVLWQILSHFFLLALIAFSLVVPLAAWSLKDWLSNFAYHIELDAKIFLLTLIAILLLSTLAVIYQVVKVAIQNPVKALRYE